MNNKPAPELTTMHWFRITLTGSSPCFVLVRAARLIDALDVVTQRYPRRSVTEITDPGTAWDVIDLADLLTQEEVHP